MVVMRVYTVEERVMELMMGVGKRSERVVREVAV